MSWHTLSLPLPQGVVIAAGAVLFILGSATKLWAAATLGGRAYYWYNFFTAEYPPLSTDGPYRFLKNPMYTVGYLLLYGLALFTMSLPGLAAAAFDQATILAFHRWVEEPHFERRGILEQVEHHPIIEGTVPPIEH
jgi:protein-S-isoprenylcysteine O-methyltransferase Ste14